MAAADRDHHPPVRDDRHLDPRQRRDPPGPRPGGVDHDVRAHLVFAVGDAVADPHAAHGPSGHRHGHHFGEQPDVGPVAARGGEKAQRHAHGVHRRVGDLDREPQVWVEAGFGAQGFLPFEASGRHGALPARLEELLLVLDVLVADRHEQAVILLERSRAYPPQDLVLGDALDRGGTVGRGVAGAAVEQAMMAPRGSGSDLAPLDEGHAQAAERQIVGQSAAGAAAADDQDVRRRGSGSPGLEQRSGLGRRAGSGPRHPPRPRHR